MKTLSYLPTLLALTIQVMVIGQTQGNQARKIRVDIMGPKEPIKMNYANSNVTISMKEYEQLLEQANQLKVNASKLREEAISAETQSTMKRIEASEISGKISLQKFEQNKIIILDAFTRIPKNNINYTKGTVSYSESERFMKIAKEMREEAYAQLTIQARYGEMINAEEKEALALSKQQEVLSLFDKVYPQLLKHTEVLVVINSEEVKHTEVVETNKITLIQASYTTQDLLAIAAEQAYEMKMTAQQLRMNALTSSPNQKAVLLNEALSLENDVISKQVEISMLKSKMDYEKFTQNRKVIELLIEQVKENESLVSNVTQLNDEAERLMKIGKEMREEANAQLTSAAKFGAMSNAEETETLALGKQYESIQTIEKQHSNSIVASR
jgi:post-segregation antitoxin (ccd killing protein)